MISKQAIIPYSLIFLGVSYLANRHYIETSPGIIKGPGIGGGYSGILSVYSVTELMIIIAAVIIGLSVIILIVQSINLKAAPFIHILILLIFLNYCRSNSHNSGNSVLEKSKCDLSICSSISFYDDGTFSLFEFSQNESQKVIGYYSVNNESVIVSIKKPRNWTYSQQALLKLNSENKSLRIQSDDFRTIGYLIDRAAFEEVDATPMEGFDAGALDEILNLREKGLRSCVLLPLGYRDIENDWLVNLKKVRKSKEDLITEVV